jgi:uncharacterized protein (DUF2252 family)
MTILEESRSPEGGVPRAVHLTAEERAAHGRAARADTPRGSHAALDIGTARDPLVLLREQDMFRVPSLVPIRYGRMIVSPFTFFRGAATVMANDLAPTPRAGLKAQLCGDLHLANFGGFASPERDFVFDINDFDETHPGPFEWDVKRLATSFEICGRDRGFTDEQRGDAVLAVVRTYREAMATFARMRNIDVWYSRLNASAIEERLAQEQDKTAAKSFARSAAKARTNDSMKAFGRLTERLADESPRIVSNPPLVVPFRELLEGEYGMTPSEVEGVEEGLRALFRTYRRSLQHDRRRLLESYEFADFARKVVGVGSVGTRSWIMLLLGRDHADPLFLQAKEAVSSVLEPFLSKSSYQNHGQRVVEGQRLMQASSDIFLGWLGNAQSLDGQPRDYYVRQLWDWKTSARLEAILPAGLVAYARACGWTIARAHARSGDRIAIAAYLGKSETFDRAIAEFASAYADLNERDHAALVQAVADGRIACREGL